MIAGSPDYLVQGGLLQFAVEGNSPSANKAEIPALEGLDPLW